MINWLRLVKMEKKGQFNFVWLFAIIAGAAILALAVFGAIKAGDTQRYASDTMAAKSISILTEPLQAGFSEGSFGSIVFRQETRITNLCINDGEFGKNDLSVATRSGVGKEWNSAGGATSIHNKYIFSEENEEGREYYVFSKPFYFPYKVTDTIYLTTRNYCFVNAPESVEEELTALDMPNVEVENCSSSSEKVCFGSGSDCDVLVLGSCSSQCDSIYEDGTVRKNEGDLEYATYALMYAAIFSDGEIYDCNVERIFYRTSRIADGLAEKADLMDFRQCETNLKPDVLMWADYTTNATSEDLINLDLIAKSMERKNRGEICGLWE